MPFQNRVALVTGSGSGIGEATAKRLSREGATIVVADVDPQGGERVVKEINAEGGQAAFVQTDVSDEQQTEAMVQFAVDTFGGLHLAANNAGFGEAPSPMHQLEPSVFDQVIAVDLKGVWLCMRAELAHFVSNGGGRHRQYRLGSWPEGRAWPHGLHGRQTWRGRPHPHWSH